jgi:hypothetical protein
MDRRIVIAEIAVLSLFTLFAPLPSSSAELPRSYIATYEYDMGNKVARLSETLVVHNADPQPTFTLTGTSGEAVTQPTRIAPDGEIEGTSADPSVLCYNMAAATLYAALHTPAQPASVFVRVGNGSVAIPVTVTPSAASSDGSREFVGSGQRMIAIDNGDGAAPIPAQMVVAARMRVVGNAIQNVVFSEATAVGNASNIVNQQTCTLNPGVALPPAAAGTAEST